MAKRSRKSSKLTQQQYRSRLQKYEKYLATTKDEAPKSFKVWNEPYRKLNFYRREFEIYKKRFAKRESSARYGFRKKKVNDQYVDVVPYKFRDFKNRYEVTRNTLEEEVASGERERIGSVVNEMINDQAYELSYAKARGVMNYLIKEESEFLKQKGLMVKYINEQGEEDYYIKRKNLELLVRQGEFVREEVGLWDEIKDVYQFLTQELGKTSTEARDQIGQQYFDSK